MSKLKISAFTVSLDGYGAGPRQNNPLGVGGEELHEWLITTQTFKDMFGGKHGTTGVDDDFAKRSFENVGAWILGRNMFAPSRGAWPDDGWRGWWGDEPPYHCPVFVLTHHARAPLEMAGGTTFHFVTGGIEDALRRAREAAAGKDVRVGGGVATVRQYLQARLVDEIHLVISPVALGAGESLYDDLDLRALGYRVTASVPSDAAMHVQLAR